MRTHLLHVVPAVTPEAESDNGTAANDGMYEIAAVATRPALTLAAASEPRSQQPPEGRNTRGADDDYWLGGYAGI